MTEPVPAPPADAGELRRRVRAWVTGSILGSGADSAGADSAGARERDQRNRARQRSLYDAGLAGLSVPAEYGGHGLDPSWDKLFNAEVARHGVSWRGVGSSLAMLLAHASPQLKARHILAMLRGEEVWAQLLSESAAGSDLASLVTSATPVSGGYRLDGEKMWISYAEFADFGSCLARTDPAADKNAGLTMFAVPMRSAGIRVFPVRTLTGRSEFCEVFLEGVTVPADAIVGAPGDGWAVAATGRGQRNVVGAEGRSDGPRKLVGLVRDRAGDSGVDTRTADLLAGTFVRVAVERELAARVRAGLSAGALPRAASALVKLGRSWRDQANAADVLDLCGADGVFGAPPDAAALDYLEQRTSSISGGTTEVQLNTVAEHVLGLPREARPDRGVPFNTLVSNVNPVPPPQGAKP